MEGTTIKTLLLSALLLAAGCDQTTISKPSPPAAASAQVTGSACVIDERWLQHDYDHAVDYANPGVRTDFFLLVYSHSPSFCQRMAERGRHDETLLQCRSPNRFGWVIHGLWGESESAYRRREDRSHPRFCKGDLPPLPLEAIKPYLCMSPGTRLLQGQWEKHGACDFDSAGAYFDKTKALFERFPVPPGELKAGAAVSWMKDNSPALRDKWLHRSGDEFGICFSTAFEVISCPRR
ncbi:MAG TPA: hypothetical protein VIS73_11220 [Rhodocyclaceae bacterium]